MDSEAWKKRLVEALEKADVTQRAASLMAGKGPGYVHSLLAEGKDPSVTNLLTLCESAGISGIYVLFGLDVDRQTERLILKMQEKPATRDGILQVLEAEDRKEIG